MLFQRFTFKEQDLPTPFHVVVFEVIAIRREEKYSFNHTSRNKHLKIVSPFYLKSFSFISRFLLPKLFQKSFQLILIRRTTIRGDLEKKKETELYG